tara:strand:- start:3013 stop:3456 length:444 start_codon:yes stop_codon:yes gene_type:complete
MIKANELRIGNLVMADAWRSEKKHLTKIETISKGWATVNGVDEYALCINYGFVETGCSFGACIENGEVQPIPLTEEWLLKFGFDEVKRDSYYTGKNAPFSVFFKTDILYNSIQRRWYFFTTPLNEIKHVHQLQNLYFALTNEELTID